MAENTQNPVELFDMYVAHVGINATDPADADRIAGEFGDLMGLEARDTPVSVFSGTLVETMKQNGRGTKGHIGFHVNDMAAAEKWFSEHGMEINEESRALNADGTTRLVYFKQEIGGFAIHITSDK
ncbi:VOC family protein [Collinsella tanakaei]|uniref:VOC family protein n=1 Tax=Collinsella tanakaei TaxID=626935 RepID=UPI0025A4C817|nr:VOC family protein [Collinsella tanakaei]MDM8300387.1 VOC family protein [Collinsella tanakaei]